MRTLALTSRPLDTRSNGYDVRVLDLCAQTPGEVHLMVVPLLQDLLPGWEPMREGVFDSAAHTPTLLRDRLSPLRHLRTSNDRFLERSDPHRFEEVRRVVADAVRRHRIDRVVAFGTDLAEVAATLPDLPVLVDVIDSGSLTMRRRLQRSDRPGGREWLRERTNLRRVEATERRLPHRFDQVTTVSAQDTRHIEQLARTSHNTTTVPNGVDPTFVRPGVPSSTSRSVAFWGNLAFEPNQDALRFLLDDVYRPHLRPAGVGLAVIGPHAPAWLEQEVAREDGVSLPGFVPDLPEALLQHPVMVNPMRLGSGLKNKVLEAFGLGLVVVSTRRGVEAFPDVRDGEHVVLADDPAEFAARAIALLDQPSLRQDLRDAAGKLVEEHYRWEQIGRSWQALLSGLTPQPGR